jgi:hypothetical protein
LVREARLNFAGIRRLLALLPCWEFRNCGHIRRMGCPILLDAGGPCWANRACCARHTALEGASRNTAGVQPDCASNNAGAVMEECYFCAVYRSAPSCENLKALLAATAEIARPATQPTFE